MGILWLIVIISSVLFSAASKSKRRGESGNSPQNSAEITKEEYIRRLNEMLGNKAPTQETATTARNQKSTPRPANRAKAQEQAKTPVPAPVNRAASSKKDIPAANNTPTSDTDKTSDTTLEQLKEEFSIEKAVIYSEILRPKYLEYE